MRAEAKTKGPFVWVGSDDLFNHHLLVGQDGEPIVYDQASLRSLLDGEGVLVSPEEMCRRILQEADSNEAYMELRYQLTERLVPALKRLGTYCSRHVDENFLIQRPQGRIQNFE